MRPAEVIVFLRFAVTFSMCLSVGIPFGGELFFFCLDFNWFFGWRSTFAIAIGVCEECFIRCVRFCWSCESTLS